jgi:hypothetical protein
MRVFNIAGPCRPDWHYMIPPEARLPGVVALVDNRAYFAVHAPRQTGKTTTMKAIARRLTEEGRYAALHFSCETGRAFPEDVSAAERAVWGSIEDAARRELPEPLHPPARTDAPAGAFLRTQLARWAETCPRPLVLIFDEIDALIGNSLISVLSQLRAGFPDRPTAFPSSVALCGMRDVRDYKAASGSRTFDADFEYVVDLGLVAPNLPVRIANPIYREIILRVLASPVEAAVYADPRSYIAADGRLDMDRLLHSFADFWREHGEILAGHVEYAEVAAQLVFMAYLHRIVNGGGFIDREVGIGRKRIDLLVRWPSTNAHGERALQRAAFELKVWRDRDKKGDPLGQGLTQLDEYLARLGLDEGVLVIFDGRSAAAPN